MYTPRHSNGIYGDHWHFARSYQGQHRDNSLTPAQVLARAKRDQS